MTTNSAQLLYRIDGGNSQKIFLKDTEVGWKRVLGNPDLHRHGGQTKYEYLEFVLERMEGDGRKCLDNWLTSWNWKLTEEENPNLEAAIEREIDRALWRVYYEERAVHTLRRVAHPKVGPAPIRPDDPTLEFPVLEPPDLEEFYECVKSEFKHASTNYLADLHSFRGDPKESLAKLSTRFDEMADPLIMHKQMTSRHLALHFVNHLPAYIRKNVESQMQRIDFKRRDTGEPLVNKEELLKMAKKWESNLLEQEAEQRAASVTPPARETAEYKHLAPPKDPAQKKLDERLTPRMEDRLGPRTDRLPESRKCNICGVVGHIARFCKSAPPPPPVAAPSTSQRPPPRSGTNEHKTEGAVCTACKKTGHVEEQCWTAHPERQPTDGLRKRNGAMASMEARQRRRMAAAHFSPDYDF